MYDNCYNTMRLCYLDDDDNDDDDDDNDGDGDDGGGGGGGKRIGDTCFKARLF